VSPTLLTNLAPTLSDFQILALIQVCGWTKRTLKQLAKREHMPRTRGWEASLSGTSHLMTSGVFVLERGFPFLKQPGITCEKGDLESLIYMKHV
jgi:hypothetical protein